MADLIGRIAVTDIAPSGTFPLKPDYGYGYAEGPQVAIHQFESGNAKIDQRFLIGSGINTYSFHRAKLREADRVLLRDFWEARKGPYQPFTYNAPTPDGNGTTPVLVRFADPQIAFEFFSKRQSRVDLTFVEHVTADSAPTFAINRTLERFPDGTLATALLDQVQEIVPLLKLRVKEAAVPDIYLSDRRVTVGGVTYLPRLLDWGAITQAMTGESDQAPFTLGDADSVFTALVADTQLQRAGIEFSLFHVPTGTLINLWKGEAVKFEKTSPTQFQITAADGLYELRLPYPTRKVTKTCWKSLGNANMCPYSGGMPCDKGWDTPQGCIAHGMQEYFGGQAIDPQGVRIKDNGQGVMGFGRPTLTATSIVNDSAFSQVVPEVYTDSQMPVNVKIIAGRDESDFFDALAVVSEGPIQGYARDGYACPMHLLDGQLNHGMEDENKHGRHDPNSARTWYGLWENLGTDPSSSPGGFTGTDSFGLHSLTNTSPYRAAGTAFVEIRRSDPSGIQLSSNTEHKATVYIKGGMSGWVWTAPGARTTQLLTNPIWICVNSILRARGLRFADAATCEKFIDIPAAIQAAAICDQTVPVLVGQKQVTGARIDPAGDYNLKTNAEWFTPADVGQQVTVPGANGGANLVTTIAQFISPICVGLTDPCSTAVSNVTAVVGALTEKQYRFRGTLDTEKSLNQWLTEILNNCCGYFTQSFGKIRFGVRGDAVAVEDFNEGNVVLNSLQFGDATPTFNHITVNFADEEYQYQGAGVQVYDIDHALEISGADGPQFLQTQFNLCGAFTKSQAGRVGAVRLREEVGGTTAEERRKHWTVSFRTTLLGLNVYPGMVCSLTHYRVPGGYMKFRVTSLRFNKDFTIDVQGIGVTDSMYDLVGYPGPKPASVRSVSVPGELIYDLTPGDVQPIGTDPFTVTPVEDSGSVTYQIAYNPPAIIGVFQGVTVQVEMSDGSGQIAQAADFDYNGNPDAADDTRYGTCKIVVQKQSSDVPIRLYLTSRSRTYKKPLVLHEDPALDGETPNVAETLGAASAPGTAPQIPVLSVTAAETSRSEDNGLHAIITLTATLASVPTSQAMSVWADLDDGKGWRLQRQWTAAESPTLIPVEVWVPTDAAHTWKFAVASGVLYNDTPPEGAAQCEMTMQPASILTPDLIKNAQVVNDPVTGGLRYILNTAGQMAGQWTWNFYEVKWDLPATLGEIWFVPITVQKGAIIDGVWTPAPDAEGIERQIADNASLGFTRAGSTCVLMGDPQPDWTMPAVGSIYNIFRFQIYAYSRRSDGTGTLQTCWPGGADHFDLIPEIPGVATVVGQEKANSRYQDKNAGVHTVVSATVTMASDRVPQTVSAFLSYGDGLGWRCQGPFTITESPQTLDLEVWLPTDADQNWQIAFVAGGWTGSNVPIATLPSGAVASVAFPMAAVAACPPDDCTGASVGNYLVTEQLDGTKSCGFTVTWTNPTLAKDQAFNDAQLFVQIGTGYGAEFTPLSDWRGAANRKVGNCSEAGAVASLTESGWAIDGYTVRLVIKAVSRRGTETSGGEGTKTIQNCWPGGAAYYEFTPVTTGLNLTKADPGTIGDGLTLALGKLSAKVTSGLQFDANGNISVKNGSGIAFDVNGNVSVNQGVGLQVDGNGFLTIKTSTGLAAGAGGVYIPGGAITNSLLAALAVAQGNLQNGAVGTSQLAYYAVGTLQCQNGFITNALLGTAVVGTANIQNAAITNALVNDLWADKIKGGTIAATISITSPVINGGTFTGVAITGATITGTVSITSPTISGATITGSNISLSSGSWTVTISTSTGHGYPVEVANGAGAFAALSSGAVYLNDGNYGATLSPTLITLASTAVVMFGPSTALSNGQFVGTGCYCPSFDGTFYSVTVKAGGVTCNGISVLNSSGQFVGAGVICTGYGVAAAGFNPYVSGTQYYGSTSDVALTVNVGGTDYSVKVNGSVKSLSFKGGAYVGAI
jgi:hypothetical protein